MSNPELGSHLPFVHHRASHVAVTWKDLVIIWGGMMDENHWPWGALPPEYENPEDEDEEPWATEHDPNAVYCHMNGKWIPKTTYGDVPPGVWGTCWRRST